MSLSSIFSSETFVLESRQLSHDVSWQVPQACEHGSPFFLQPHLIVPQPVEQLHLIPFKRMSGAGGRSIVIGTYIPLLSLQPQLEGFRALSVHFHTHI